MTSRFQLEEEAKARPEGKLESDVPKEEEGEWKKREVKEVAPEEVGW